MPVQIIDSTQTMPKVMDSPREIDSSVLSEGGIVRKRLAEEDLVSLEVKAEHSVSSEPLLYSPFRAIGYVTADVPLCIQSQGQAFFITSSIGRAFHIYGAERMNLLFVSTPTQQLEVPISALTAFKQWTFAAVGSDIFVFQRAKQIATMTANQSPSSHIFLLEGFGEFLISVHSDNCIGLWNSHSQCFIDSISAEKLSEAASGAPFYPSAMLHPSTYVNKVLLGSHQGTLQLWNVRTKSIVFDFRDMSLGSPITTLAQSPCIDVVAIGLLDGSIILHNIKANGQLMRFQQQGKVTDISFRTDGPPIMATASAHGDVCLWNLDERRLAHMLSNAHDAAIHTCRFLHAQPILLTASSDNAIKQWIFDAGVDGAGRLLKLRSGHHQAPSKIEYYGHEDGYTLLSSAQDQSLRVFSTIRDSRNVELSQGAVERKANRLNVHADTLKLPPISGFAASPAKQSQWDNILTCHVGERMAKTWSMQRKAVGKFTFQSTDGSIVRSVCISTCGNFGFLGCASGRVDMYNLQSGMHRKTFGGEPGEGHAKPVTGMAVDATNRYLFSASLDGTLKVWTLRGKLQKTIAIGSAISKLLLHPTVNLIAIVSDDLTIRILDADTCTVIREFRGHKGRITDITFSPDARWLVSAALDGSIRTWDLPTGFMIDGFKCDSIVTSLTFSPTGDFLATSHAQQIGVYLWANRAQFSTVSMTRKSEKQMPMIFVSGHFGQHSTMASDVDDEEDSEDEGSAQEMDLDKPWVGLNDLMITLSTLPSSTWQNLLNIAAIKKRNKPVAPPKAPEKAPFFLTTTAGVVPTFVPAADQADTSEAVATHRLNKGDLNLQSEFNQHLLAHEYDSLLTYMKSLGPSAIDFELSTLRHDSGFPELVAFLEAIAFWMRGKKDIELAEAYLNVFLKHHADIILANGSVFAELLNGVKKEHERMWDELDSLFQYSLCLTDFAKGSAA